MSKHNKSNKQNTKNNLQQFDVDLARQIINHQLDGDIVDFVGNKVEITGISNRNRITCIIEVMNLITNTPSKIECIVDEHGRDYSGNQTLFIKVKRSIFKSEHKFRPLEQVLVRDGDDSIWRANLFVWYDNTNTVYKFHTINDIAYKHCIPYKGNEELVNTTKPYLK